MKRLITAICILLLCAGVLAGCGETDLPEGDDIVIDGPLSPTPQYEPSEHTLALRETEAYDGFFDTVGSSFTVTYLSGTPGGYELQGNTLIFSNMTLDSSYAISGNFRGNIIIDVGDERKLELELWDFSIISGDTSPITVISADEVTLTAKEDTKNYVYDVRPPIDENDTEAHSGAVFARSDLELKGKGSLTVVSENNNGIHSKDDVKIKNLTLTVSCVDNAVKGNDGVDFESGTTTLISTEGDAVKTSSTDLSQKGKQKGSVTVTGGNHTLYAARDGIDAAYAFTMEGADTVLNIYTHVYGDYFNSEARLDNSHAITISTGNMIEDNPHKIDFSAKGIKAKSAVTVVDGTLNIKAYDDCIRVKGEGRFESGAHPYNTVSVTGGSLTLYSNDDAIHANEVALTGGDVRILYCYEGIEGTVVIVDCNSLTIFASDDGINGKCEDDTAVYVNGGDIFIAAGGDAIDSNTDTEYRGIVFTGGRSALLTYSNIDSTVDTDEGYTVEGGKVLAIVSNKGNIDENLHCYDFNNIGVKKFCYIENNDAITVSVDGEPVVTATISPLKTINVVWIGDTDITVTPADAPENGAALWH